MKLGESFVIKEKNIVSIFVNNERSIKITKNKSEYVVECIGHSSTRIRIKYKDNTFKIIPIVIESKEPNDTIKIGMKSVIRSKKIFDFWNTFDSVVKKNIDCLYFECYFSYLEDYAEIIRIASELGITEVFLILSENIEVSLVSDFISYSIKNIPMNFYLIIKNIKVEYIDYPKVHICPSITLGEKIESDFSGYRYIAYNAKDTKDYTNDMWLDSVLSIKKNNFSNIRNIIYNIPPGYSNNILEINPYTNTNFKLHTNTPTDYESGASLFFFGGIVNRLPDTNKWNDYIETNNGQVTVYPEHISLCLKYSIKYLLFGPSSVDSTTNIPWLDSVGRVTDSMYTLSKIK